MSEYAVTLPALASMVGVARRAVAVLLDGEPAVEDATRIVSEFVTNAVAHAAQENGSSVVLHIIELRRAWRLAVVGPNGAYTYPGGPEDGEGRGGDFGRGLLIVDALADKWGTDAHPESVTWWAELAR